MIQQFLPEGAKLTTNRNVKYLSSQAMLESAKFKGEILEAVVLSCDTNHNLTVNLGCMKGIIPRSEGAIGIDDGTTRDIALISRVGKAVSFTVEDFTYDDFGEKQAILSRKNAQLRCREQYILNLKPGDVIPAKVTHIEPFGAFCDIGCGCVALMPIDAISISRIQSPADRFSCKESIKAVVKSVIDGKITLSMKELLGTWEQNAKDFSQGETVSGIIRSVESYGIFVELTPNLAGLAESKAGVKVGQTASVYIKSILRDKMKIKLIIVDSFDSDDTKLPINYYVNDSHVDYWRYSPDDCSKIIESYFN